jgi:mono/diheme cytochrome c family protein
MSKHIVGCAVAGFILLGARVAAAQEVTFTRDVAPILFENCVECHRQGSFAPMSLLTYEEARRYAQRIHYRVANRQMPPWHVDESIGIQDFSNDVSLTDAEIQTIVRWVEAGSPRGDGADMPPVPELAAGGAWQAEQIIGRPPDLVIQSTPYSMGANVQDQWWNPAVPWEALGGAGI